MQEESYKKENKENVEKKENVENKGIKLSPNWIWDKKVIGEVISFALLGSRGKPHTIFVVLVVFVVILSVLFDPLSKG